MAWRLFSYVIPAGAKISRTGRRVKAGEVIAATPTISYRAPSRKIRPSRPAGHEHGTDYAYVFDYDRCTGCAICHDQCPVHAIEMISEEP